MTALYESDVEEFAVDLLKKQGYTYLSPEEQALESGPTRYLAHLQSSALYSLYHHSQKHK